MDLETRQLQHLLSQTQQSPEVLLLKSSTTSTNDDVREIVSRGVQSVLVCSALQTRGRGQRQHTWVSPEGNIYLSTFAQTQTPIDGRFALEIALNILQMPSLQQLDLQVKWPNDLYSSRGKWGGILVEPISAHQVIIGVGLNLMPIMDTQIDQKTSSLFELGYQQQNRIQLIAELYLAIQQAVQWFDHNSHNLAARFNHHASFLNQAIRFEQQDEVFEGIFTGIQNDGAICLQTADGLKTFYQGRLRPQSAEVE